MTLNYDGVYSFAVSNADIVTWRSNDEFVGTINANGYFTAHHIGEAVITATLPNNVILSAVVTVEPYITNISEPIILFGASIDQVKALEDRFLAAETDRELTYTGRADLNELSVSYAFPLSTLSSSTIVFNGTAENVLENVNTFYRERYQLGEAQGNVLSFVSRDQDFSVSIDRILAGNIEVIYTPYDSAD